MTYPAHDNDATLPTAKSGEPDAHGQAAMLLVESLLHALIAQSVLKLEEAIDLVGVAIDAKIEIAADLGNSDDTRDRSLALLTAIHQTLSHDIT